MHFKQICSQYTFNINHWNAGMVKKTKKACLNSFFVSVTTGKKENDLLVFGQKLVANSGLR